MRLAAATPSPSALQAAFHVAALGGSAVDAAIAASVTAMVQEIGICSPGGGGFITVGGRTHPVTYDGYVATPGLGRDAEAPVVERSVSMAYGGGMTTVVGPGSIAVPGIWRAFEAAHADHGRVEWPQILVPAIRTARDGFTMGTAVFTYLVHSHEVVYGDDPATRDVLHDPDGTLVDRTARVALPDLADTLEAVASHGAGHLHSGGFARRLADDLGRRGSRLTYEDLDSYRCERRAPIEVAAGRLAISTNPTPAVGGEALAAILERLPATPRPIDHFEAQREVFTRRRDGDPLRSASTIHVSVVDETGLACALTASSGYGSGVIPTGTGLMMNNAFGELELVPKTGTPSAGDRMVSNMAPSVAASLDGDVLAVGTPGASRITSALSQFLASVALDGADLQTAVERPRLHVEVGDEGFVALEPGIGPLGTGLPERPFAGLHMYFGGVGAARRTGEGELMAVADPRREGAAGVTAA